MCGCLSHALTWGPGPSSRDMCPDWGGTQPTEPHQHSQSDALYLVLLCAQHKASPNPVSGSLPRPSRSQPVAFYLTSFLEPFSIGPRVVASPVETKQGEHSRADWAAAPTSTRLPLTLCIQGPGLVAWGRIDILTMLSLSI